MNEKTGSVRRWQAFGIVFFGILAAYAWALPVRVVAVACIAIAVLLAFQILHAASIMLDLKRKIADVHGPQPFLLPFFLGEEPGALKERALNDQVLVEMARALPEYRRKGALQRLTAQYDMDEVIGILHKAQERLHREARELVLRAVRVGVDAEIAHRLIDEDIEKARARVDAWEWESERATRLLTRAARRERATEIRTTLQSSGYEEAVLALERLEAE